MKYTFHTLFHTLFMIIGISAFAQKGTIEGSVIDQSGNPISNVDLYLEGTKIGTVSDVRGNFRVEEIATGHYTLKASSIGFKTFTRQVDIAEGMRSIKITLSESLFELPVIIIERETMTGGSQFMTDIPGSAHYVGPRQLNKFSYNDVNRILRNIPGINIQEEEGFGLRPNIGMRGTGVERSSKITLMEDGILTAPAPYIAPAAYYFPTAGRMEGVEVRKGSSQIKYGPYTTGGAVNFISTLIPQDFSAKINMMGGNYGRRIAQASIGQSFEYGGFMLETYQNTATGFKELDNGGPTGFSNQDYVGKFRVNSPLRAKVYQSLTFKVGQSIGKADETYLGLTQDDFDKTPNRRYAGSQIDNINTKQEQYSLKYNIMPAKFLDISITAYRNDFSRNWYKLEGVKYNPLSDPAVKSVPITNVLDDPTKYQGEYSILTGATSSNDDALFVRNNNRKYYAQGVQGLFGLNFNSSVIKHDIEIGFRYHEDEEDRFQWEDQYKMNNGVMQLTKSGTPGTQDNRVSDAKALAGYVQYSLKFGNFLALPGIRYESITLSRLDYGKTDPDRTGVFLAKTDNKVDVWIPGVGLEYSFSSKVQGFLGIHRGFAPPGATDGTSPEKSINYEIGGRINHSNLSVQSVLFFNNYQNLLGSDLAAAGGGGTGDLFNAGKVRTYGLEAQLAYYWLPATFSSFAIPLALAYTYTSGEFESSFVATNQDWGTVNKGDHLPYLSNHQITFNAGLEHKSFNINLSSKYNSEMRTAPGEGNIPDGLRIDSNFIVDFSVNYKITRFITAIGNVNNLMDEVYGVARRPAGIRPGLPRTFLLGVKVFL